MGYTWSEMPISYPGKKKAGIKKLMSLFFKWFRGGRAQSINLTPTARGAEYVAALQRCSRSYNLTPTAPMGGGTKLSEEVRLTGSTLFSQIR